MPDRSTPWTPRIARTALLATMLCLGLASAAQGQRTGGSIGVSLTILRPLTSQAVGVVGFAVDRDGRATVETTAPAVGPVSQIVMASVSVASSGDSVSVPARRAAATSAAPRASYLVDLGALARPSAAGEPVQLRLRYLTVAGT